MIEIKKIKKLSLANLAGLIYAMFGLLLGLIFSSYSLIKFAIGKNIDKTFFSWLFTNLGLNILSSLAIALATGVIGWLVGILLAFLYNFFANEIGGIKIELVEETYPKLESNEIKKQDLFKY